MNKDLYRWICELVRKNPTETTERPYSITGRKVQEKYQCGDSWNGKLVFTAEHKRTLRILVKGEFDLDPYVDDLPDRRTDVARFHDNEKLARKPASHDHVLLNCPAGKLKLNGRIHRFRSSVHRFGRIDDARFRHNGDRPCEPCRSRESGYHAILCRIHHTRLVA